MRGNISLRAVLVFSLAVAAMCALPAGAASLIWDADAGTTGAQDGGGAWLGTGQWWDGGANVTWTSGDDAVFGSGGNIGNGVNVTLDANTTVNSLTVNAFTSNRGDRYYSLGTSGQTMTLNNGIVKNAGSGPVRLVSPIPVSYTHLTLPTN